MRKSARRRRRPKKATAPPTPRSSVSWKSARRGILDAAPFNIAGLAWRDVGRDPQPRLFGTGWQRDPCFKGRGGGFYLGDLQSCRSSISEPNYNQFVTIPY